jgi:ribosomal protein S18
VNFENNEKENIELKTDIKIDNLLNKTKYQKHNIVKKIFLNKKLIVKFCIFCNGKYKKEELWFLNIGLLIKYTNSKGQINSSFNNKFCTKHQKQIRLMIIRARYLHLLPYTLN